jgi:hypothetical protein
MTAISSALFVIFVLLQVYLGITQHSLNRKGWYLYDSRFSHKRILEAICLCKDLECRKALRKTLVLYWCSVVILFLVVGFFVFQIFW